jgi:hypothetical protein
VVTLPSPGWIATKDGRRPEPITISIHHRSLPSSAMDRPGSGFLRTRYRPAPGGAGQPAGGDARCVETFYRSRDPAGSRWTEEYTATRKPAKSGESSTPLPQFRREGNGDL